ncbi:MAG: DNA-binding transcriptional LysR family regulator [Cellvibrionaceae bacterium]|jgi:DNA-binding transcriptional LysR family regulator
MIKYDLKLLKVFDAIYNERNITRAAERIHISQPAMSEVLTRLRHLFNEPVFIRNKFGVAPQIKLPLYTQKSKSHWMSWIV